MKKEIMALLLAGGQGSRLGVLTKKIAKPAVLYGGKYRIIDFSLSNCINSGIDNVGVLTQYRPQKLNSHIGIGKPWDMDRITGGVTVLSPYMTEDAGQWYLGTANAIFHNIDYIDKVSPKYVIILSGDHIYKMDYSKMIGFHKGKQADATISVIGVPLHEACRYGIMNTDNEDRIFEFEEKPAQPKNTLASMGVYVFSWKILREYLINDDQDKASVHDFGKNIIPKMLNDGKSMWAYRFDGYWRDVGTIQSYWESNMDLVKRVPEFNLYDPDWKIYTPNPVKPAHYVAPEGRIKTSIVAEGCMIYGEVNNSVLFPGVYVSSGAVIKDSIVMSNSFIGRNSIIDKAIISESVVCGDNVKIGIGENIANEKRPDLYNCGITVIGEKASLPDNLQVGKNVVIEVGINQNNYCSFVVESGQSVLKGEECE